MNIGEFKADSIKKLKSSPSPVLDIDVLLEFSLGFSKTQLLLKRDFHIPQNKLEWLLNAVQKRTTGLPIAYITGCKEFYGYNFSVSPSVLIPKPDTEILVENAINLIKEKIFNNPNRILTICDMCTGSGCIGISVLKNLFESQKIPYEKLPKFTLVDISYDALEIARKNSSLLKNSLNQDISERVRFIHSNLFEQVPGTFDVILTNPPYIPHKMVEELLLDGRNEPRLALDGDISLIGERSIDSNGDELNDGLSVIKNLLLQSKEKLSRYGTILMETGEYNADDAAIFGNELNYKTEIIKDLEGQKRVVKFTSFQQETDIL